MKGQRMRYEVTRNWAWTATCLYIKGNPPDDAEWFVCKFKRGSDLVDDLKEKMKVHYATAHGENE